MPTGSGPAAPNQRGGTRTGCARERPAAGRPEPPRPAAAGARTRAQANPRAALAHAAHTLDLRQDLRHRLLFDALADAGVTLGAFDAQIADWLARTWEPETVAVLAALITRDHTAGKAAADGVGDGPSKDLPTAP